MRRRLGPTVAVVLFVLSVGIPAQSEPNDEGPPRTHVAGIGLDAAPGGPRVGELPRLVRPGSDRRDGAEDATSTNERRVLAPVVVPPTFDGVPNLNPFASPADPTGALGVNNHLAAVNVHAAFYDRTTGLPLDPPRRLRVLDKQLPGGVDDFDPHVLYDAYRQVFVLVFASASDSQSFLSVVVIPEGQEDSTNGWCVLHMSGDQVSNNGKQLADYPMIGFTENRLTLSTNQFSYANAPFVGGFQYVQIVSFRKSDLYDCDVPVVPIKVFSGNQTKDPDGSRAFTIVPASSVGGSPTTQFMASIDFNGSTGKLILWRLKVTNGALRLARAHITGGPMGYPRFGRQCGPVGAGLNDNWDTGDLRLTSAFWDGGTGRLYTATAIAGNLGGGADESVIRWWEVDPASTLANSDVIRRGTVGAAGRDVAWPSVATDGNGKLWVNYARAGTSECLSAYAAVVQPAATAAASVLIKTGDGRYEYGPGLERWGDYTAIARDPVDPAVMAAYGAYPIDDGVGGSPTDLWRQVVATLGDV